MKIIDYQDKYLDATVKMWRDTKYLSLNIEDLHSEAEYKTYLKELLLADNKVRIGIYHLKVVALIVYNKEEVLQLYIDSEYQGKGFGRQLLDEAKAYSKGGLSLHTFQMNTKAIDFYTKAGFKIVGSGNDNEEGLEDYLMKWENK